MVSNIEEISIDFHNLIINKDLFFPVYRQVMNTIVFLSIYQLSFSLD